MKKKNFIIILEEEQDGGYSVSVPLLPGCFSQGDNLEDALKNIQSAIKLYLKDVDKELINIGRKELIMPLEVGV